MALLAYEDPEKSPMFHLLSSEYRQQVADNLNRTILGQFFFFCSSKKISCDLYKLHVLTHFSHCPEHANHPSYTPMERLIQQVTAVRQYLTEENGKVIIIFQYLHIYLFRCRNPENSARVKTLFHVLS